METTMDWKQLECFVGHSVPNNVKVLLQKSGYDSLLSVKQIDEQKICAINNFMKNFIKTNRETLQAIDKKDETTFIYETQNEFEILPGHRTVLLALPGYIQKMFDSSERLKGPNRNTEPETSLNVPNPDSNGYSVILSKLIESAHTNKNKSKNANRYDDILKDFATYIFLLCGRTCYETLNKNLPIPSIKTICKHWMNVLNNFTFSLIYLV